MIAVPQPGGSSCSIGEHIDSPDKVKLLNPASTCFSCKREREKWKKGHSQQNEIILKKNVTISLKSCEKRNSEFNLLIKI